MPASAPISVPTNDRDQHRGEADRERDTPAIDHARQNVLAEIVGAEGMRQRRPLQPRHEVDVVDLDPPDEAARPPPRESEREAGTR